MISKNEKAELQKLLRVLTAVKAVDPGMQLQTLETMLRVGLANTSGITMTQLQRDIGMTLAGVSRNIALLSKVNVKGSRALGFVDPREDPMDRRYKIIHATPKGEQFIHAVAQAANPEVTNG